MSTLVGGWKGRECANSQSSFIHLYRRSCTFLPFDVDFECFGNLPSLHEKKIRKRNQLVSKRKKLRSLCSLDLDARGKLNLYPHSRLDNQPLSSSCEFTFKSWKKVHYVIEDKITWEDLYFNGDWTEHAKYRSRGHCYQHRHEATCWKQGKFFWVVCLP